MADFGISAEVPRPDDQSDEWYESLRTRGTSMTLIPEQLYYIVEDIPRDPRHQRPWNRKGVRNPETFAHLSSILEPQKTLYAVILRKEHMSKTFPMTVQCHMFKFDRNYAYNLLPTDRLRTSS